jgi:hypothetical protein
MWIFVGSYCSDDEYQCKNRLYIPGTWACDAYVDCPEGEDEMGCEGNELIYIL